MTVSAWIAEQTVRVDVADTGIGIQPQDVGKVFEEFRQVDGSPRRRHEGTGLGIPLSKRLIELHGGSMWLESTPGQGSTFSFTLPVSSNGSASQGHVPRFPVPPTTAQSALRDALLVLEPGPLLLHTLRRYIDGYDVIEVPQLKSLLELVDRHQPVAMLVDGERQKQLQVSGAWPADLPSDLPIVEFPFQDDLDRARSLGTEGYLIKPVTRPQLLAAVDRLEADIRRVLIVDDDPQLTELLSRMLESTGKYQPVKALGGEPALTHMRRQRPDLVLLDLVMPEVDGMAVLKAMRADRALADIPVVIVSAHAYLEDETVRGGHSFGVTRREEFPLLDLLNGLRSLLDALPRRLSRRPESVPTYSATLTGSRAF